VLAWEFGRYADCDELPCNSLHMGAFNGLEAPWRPRFKRGQKKDGDVPSHLELSIYLVQHTAFYRRAFSPALFISAYRLRPQNRAFASPRLRLGYTYFNLGMEAHKAAPPGDDAIA